MSDDFAALLCHLGVVLCSAGSGSGWSPLEEVLTGHHSSAPPVLLVSNSFLLLLVRHLLLLAWHLLLLASCSVQSAHLGLPGIKVRRHATFLLRPCEISRE